MYQKKNTLSLLKFKDRSSYADSYKYGYDVGDEPPILCDIFQKTKAPELEDLYKKIRETLVKNPMLIPLVVGEKGGFLSILDAASEGNHILIGGMQGSGKTNLVYQILIGLLLNTSNEFCKITALDHSKGTFSKFKNHIDTVYGEGKIIDFLKELKKDMLERFKIMNGFDKISEYNEQTNEVLPFRVFLFDELPALKNAEGIQLLDDILSQGRSVGYTFVFTAQRPCYKSIDSRIKSHIPNLLCLRVSSGINEEVILGTREYNAKLQPKGDMIFFSNGNYSRIKAPYHPLEDIKRLLCNLSNAI